MGFLETTSDVQLLDGSVLKAQCRDDSGQFRTSFLPLNAFLGNINGSFVWGSAKFSLTANNVSLNGAVLSGSLQTESATWQNASIDLSNDIRNSNGSLQAILPAVFKVPHAAVQDVSLRLKNYISANPGDAAHMDIFSVVRPEVLVLGNFRKALPSISVDGSLYRSDSDNLDIGVGEGGVSIDPDQGIICTTYTAEAHAALMQVKNDSSNPWTKVKFSVARVGVSATAGTYFGVNADASLIKLQAGPFAANLGIGIGDGIGIKDDSAEVDVDGCGFTIGRKIGISVLGNSISFDFGHIMGW